MKQKNIQVFLLLLILFFCFFVRLYRFDNPIADWHSWRQADTSAVSRNFVKYGFDLLHPRMNNISNVQSGLDNPQGYFFTEFPIYNAVQAGLFKFLGIFTIEEWGRLVTIFSSCLTSLFLYLIVSRHSNKAIGLFAAFFFAFIPYDIYYGRTILADTSMAMAVLGGIYFFDKWITSDKGKVKGEKSQHKTTSFFYFVLSAIFTAGAFLLKPYAVFFVLPMVVLAYKYFGWKLLLRWQLWLFAIIAVVPLAFWRIWMLQYPAGIPVSAWLLNGNGIRFRPAFFRWIGYERLTKLISGYLGIILVLIGVAMVKKLREWLFFASFLLSSLLYVCVFATGNVQHDYYQILIMPSVAIFFAIGSYYLSRFHWNKLPIGTIVVVICIVGGFFFAWQQVKDYFNINNRAIVVAGQAVDRLTPKDAKVIANYGGDSSFLYQTNRQGWASFEKPIPELIKMGASYMIIVNPATPDFQLAKTYHIVEKTDQYLLLKLKS